MPSVYLLGGELPGGKDHLLLQEHNKGKGEGGVPGVKRGTIRTRVLAKCIPVQQSGERVPTHSFTPGAIYPPLLFSYSSSDAVSLISTSFIANV